MVVISIIFVVQTLVFWIFLESDRTPSKSQDPFSHPELWSLLAMKIRLDDLEDIYAFPVFLSCFFLVVVEKWPSIWRAVGVFLDFGGVVGVVCWVNLMFMCLRTTVLGHIVIMRVYFEFPDTLLALILGPTGHKFVAECSWLVPYALVFFVCVECLGMLISGWQNVLGYEETPSFSTIFKFARNLPTATTQASFNKIRTALLVLVLSVVGYSGITVCTEL